MTVIGLLGDVSCVLEEPLIGWLREQELISESPIEVLAKIWSGTYKVYVAWDEFKPVGMIVCRIDKETCLTVLVYAKNQLFKLREQFYTILKNSGIKRVCTYSKHHSEGYEKLTGLKHMYSYYEKEL